MAAIPFFQLEASAEWALWNSYVDRFLSPDGRIADPAVQGQTTSEAQAYGLFFALVADDRERFERLLEWTQNNLANGDLTRKLPAWQWGKSPQGAWMVLDHNSASDADLWIAYSLLEAGRHWNEPRYKAMGEGLAAAIARFEVADIPGLGPMMLPGYRDFKVDDTYFLNASYLPLQLLWGVASHCPEGPWRAIAGNVPRLVKASAPKGFALDWVSYRPGHGFGFAVPSGKKQFASYDAIRIYLWAGMLPAALSARRTVVESLPGMSRVLSRQSAPPAVVNLDGSIENPQGSVGFSAAVVPFLMARGERARAEAQRRRVSEAFNRNTGLHGASPNYYDQNLILFSEGWLENRYQFTPDGRLYLSRRQK
ncbi:MAG: cellulose synthase complex periplasmic endoglucanase BcsZ [Acidobacteriota bacterium]